MIITKNFNRGFNQIKLENYLFTKNQIFNLNILSEKNLNNVSIIDNLSLTDKSDEISSIQSLPITLESQISTPKLANTLSIDKGENIVLSCEDTHSHSSQKLSV